MMSIKLELTHSGSVEKPADKDIVKWAEYYIFKEVQGAGSKHTQKAKLRDLELFLDFFTSHCGRSIDGWNKGLTSKFLGKLQKKYSVSSIRRIYASVSHFGRFLERMGLFQHDINPVKKVRLPEQEPLMPQGIRAVKKKTYEVVLQGEELFKKIIEVVSNTDYKLKLRDLAIVTLLYYTGLRVDEIVNLKIEQMDHTPDGMWLRSVKCKGNKFRDVYVNDTALSHLKQYIQHERGLNRGYIFLSKTNKRLSPSDIWRTVRRVCSLTEGALGPDIIIEAHPHSFRHERAYNLLRKTRMGDAFVAEQLGHSNTNYIARYTRRTDKEIVEILKSV